MKDHKALLDKQIQEYIKEGPNVYELFVVSVHSGSSMGGHYYVYIKSFENGLWYKYDDSRVTIMNYDVIETAFGEHYPKSIYIYIYIYIFFWGGQQFFPILWQTYSFKKITIHNNNKKKRQLWIFCLSFDVLESK